MEGRTVYITSEPNNQFNIPGYSDDITVYFDHLPQVASPLISGSKKAFSKIEKLLYSAPAFLELLKSQVPEQTFQAILTKDQKKQLAEGTLKLMTKKDGTLMANLVNPETKKIVSTISLESVEITPEITEAMTNYATQMQMMQIAEEIQQVQIAIEEVRQGQEYDRLATAYSCQQKFMQTLAIRNPELKERALLMIAMDAEDSRNLLMQSQSANLSFIKEQPDSFFGKMLNGAKPEKINQRMHEIRESLNAVNMVSLAQAMAYQAMGEPIAAQQSLKYYADYIDKAYLSSEGFVQKLDLIDDSTENYWTNSLPDIKNKIQALPCVKDLEQLEGE